MTAGWKKPTAVGTSRRGETSTETGRDFLNSSINNCVSGARTLESIADELRRNPRIWHKPSATRVNPTLAMAIQPKMMQPAHEAGIVTRACGEAEFIASGCHPAPR